ncbi:MAG: transposase [Flavobacteriales bacterium Tduv]
MQTKGTKCQRTCLGFHSRGIKDRIQKKAYRNRILSRIAILFNKLASKTRWVVERIFGSIKRWFG